MKRLLTLLTILAAIITHSGAQVGTWKNHLAYYETQQIVKGGNTLYIRASNGLYSYNLNDQSITTYDKVNGLSDTYITQIGWNNKTNRLIIVYQNSNIDIISPDGTITNIISLYSKSMTQDKTVNNIYMYDQYAYLSTAFGVVKLNMERAEISESYILNQNIVQTAVSGNNIYVRKSDNTVMTAELKKNLIDNSNWTAVPMPDHVFDVDMSDWNTYYETVSTLKPGGPKYNYFNRLKFHGDTFYTVGGGWRDGGEFARQGCVQIMDENQEWTIIDNLQPTAGHAFRDATSIAIDPEDASHMFIATCGTGLYELKDGQQIANYTMGNSPLTSALDEINYPNAYQDYVRVDALMFDQEGGLWMSNSNCNKAHPLLRFNPKTKEWEEFNNSALFYDDQLLYIVRQSIIDSEGNIWMVNDHHSHPCLLKINPKTKEITRFDNFTNQDGNTIVIYYVRCMAQDLNGNIWIGTEKGLYMYDKEQQQDPTLGYTQVKVPRNDGTDYADYLMENIDISSIAIDGGNQKWISTFNNGVYLISADNMEQLQHFTTDNSFLLSNEVESVAINHNTGEVYFGTKNGLCSYLSDATSAVDNMTKDGVYAYPNPVPSTYNGLITIKGLSYDADVKILTINGRLVAQGRSHGGSFTWNGCDTQGRRVASGIYMAAIATNDGKKGVVCKIAVIR